MAAESPALAADLAFLSCSPVAYTGPESLEGLDLVASSGPPATGDNLWGLAQAPIPYQLIRHRLDSAAKAQARTPVPS